MRLSRTGNIVRLSSVASSLPRMHQNSGPTRRYHEVVHCWISSSICSNERITVIIYPECFFRRQRVFAVDSISFWRSIVAMGRHLALFLLAGVTVGAAPVGSAAADSSFDMHGGPPATIQPNSLLGARRPMGHSHQFDDFRHHTIVGVPLFFFFGERIPTAEPEIEFVAPPPPPPPQPPCPPGPRDPTFTAEVTDGVRIIRGHSDRC